MLKHIRIKGTTGKVIEADKTIHVTKNVNEDGPDRVKWNILGSGGPFRVHFDSSPFLAKAGPQDINVPPSTPRPAAAPVGDYKYSVFKSNGRMTDDPNIIIRR